MTAKVKNATKAKAVPQNGAAEQPAQVTTKIITQEQAVLQVLADLQMRMGVLDSKLDAVAQALKKE